ncbi:Trp biosynthesis-associated membrane protein [Saccharothrix sp. Mg75]|uniref:Trp biosynthesis-associated membrane protein n=1 Tax=Saccharothrix sp. Mg75 TaxID=3445357 RepID=UPI003EEE9950
MSDHDPHRPEADPEAAAAARAGAARRRPLWIAVLLLLLAAGALWATSTMTWGATRVKPEATGAEVQPALVPVALFCVAAVAAAVALAGWMRRVLGALVLLAAVAVSRMVTAASPPAAAYAVVLLGLLLMAAAGLLLLVRGAAMPRLGGGYQTPGAARRSADPERELWNALERGDDPTERE